MELKDNMPGILFQSLAQTRKRAIEAELARNGLHDLGSPMILFILSSRGRGGTVTAQRELADALHVSPATIAVSLKSLEREGYVEKRAVQGDARRKGVSLTTKGQVALKTCHEVFRAVDRRMLEGFSEEDIRRINGYHTRMLRNLKGEVPDERSCRQC